MEQKQIEKLLEEVKNVCPPEFEVTIIKSARKNVALLVIKAPLQPVDVHDWCISSVYSLHWKNVSFLFEKPGDIRTLYCCGNKFVFYSPFNGVFANFLEMIEYYIYGNEEHTHYVGECQNIDNLINYITQTKRLIF